MKKLLVLISIIFLFASCVMEDHYYYIPEDMKPLLTNNDTIYYLDSVYNRTDTFCLEINKYNRVSDNRYFFEIIEIWYNLSNKNITISKNFHIGYSTTGTMKSISGASIYINSKYFNKGISNDVDNTDITKYNVNIHGVIYPTVYVLHEDYMPDTIPNTVYFTFKNGIIRYDYKDGRKYELIKK